MPATYNLIASNTLTVDTSAVTFGSIPGTYTDLLLKYSARANNSSAEFTVLVTVNGSSSSADYSQTYLDGNGSTAGSSFYGTGVVGYWQNTQAVPAATATSNTFSNNEIYIPNYAGNNKKPLSIFNAQENNTTAAYLRVYAALYNQTTAITSITLSVNTQKFVTGSSFFLYGIKNS